MHMANQKESAIFGANRIPGKAGGAPSRQVGLGYLAACAAHQPALRRRIGAHKYCLVAHKRYRAGILCGENIVEINGVRPAMPIVLGFSLDLGAVGLSCSDRPPALQGPACSWPSE